MDGTAYVVEQLGQALKASHDLIAQQAARIAELEAIQTQQPKPQPVPMPTWDQDGPTGRTTQ